LSLILFSLCRLGRERCATSDAPDDLDGAINDAELSGWLACRAGEPAKGVAIALEGVQLLDESAL
jgi:hypothetical protein